MTAPSNAPTPNQVLTASDCGMLLELLKPFAALADKFTGPMIEVCEPHPDNPSRTIQPLASMHLEAAFQAVAAWNRCLASPTPAAAYEPVELNERQQAVVGRKARMRDGIFYMLEDAEGRWLADHENGRMTRDATDALSWVSKIAADDFRRALRGTLWMLKVTEHQWCEPSISTVPAYDLPADWEAKLTGEPAPAAAGDIHRGFSGHAHTAIMEAIREELERQHPGLFSEDSDGEIVIPSGCTPASAFVKIDISALADAALSAPPKPPEGDWSEHEDEIADAISDSIDMDWTSRDGARAVVRWLNEQPRAEQPDRSWWFLESPEGAWLENAEHGDFTRDPNKALRWPNQTSADSFRASLRHPLWALKATEHRWVSSTKPPEAVDPRLIEWGYTTTDEAITHHGTLLAAPVSIPVASPLDRERFLSIVSDHLDAAYNAGTEFAQAFDSTTAAKTILAALSQSGALEK